MKGIECPNHKEPLEGLPFPITKKGIGKCPVSGVDFEYEANLDEDKNSTAVDKFGNKLKSQTYTVTGDD